jgi:hypothetical protein
MRERRFPLPRPSLIMRSWFSPSKIQGMTVGHSLGGACGLNKAYGLSLFPHQRELHTEGLLSRHAFVKYAGENIVSS